MVGGAAAPAKNRRAASAIQERRRPRDRASMPPGHQPATFPLHQHHGRAKLPSYVVAVELASLYLAARGYRRIPVDAHIHLLEGERLVG